MIRIGMDPYLFLGEFQRRNAETLKRDMGEALSPDRLPAEQVSAALSVFNNYIFNAVAALVQANNQKIAEDLSRLGIAPRPSDLL